MTKRWFLLRLINLNIRSFYISSPMMLFHTSIYCGCIPLSVPITSRINCELFLPKKLREPRNAASPEKDKFISFYHTVALVPALSIDCRPCPFLLLVPSQWTRYKLYPSNFRQVESCENVVARLKIFLHINCNWK